MLRFAAVRLSCSAKRCILPKTNSTHSVTSSTFVRCFSYSFNPGTNPRPKKKDKVGANLDKFHDREAGNRFNDQGAYFQESLEALTDAERRDLTEEELDKLEDESLGDWAIANGYTMDAVDPAVKERALDDDLNASEDKDIDEELMNGNNFTEKHDNFADHKDMLASFETPFPVMKVEDLQTKKELSKEAKDEDAEVDEDNIDEDELMKKQMQIMNAHKLQKANDMHEEDHHAHLKMPVKPVFSADSQALLDQICEDASPEARQSIERLAFDIYGPDRTAQFLADMRPPKLPDDVIDPNHWAAPLLPQYLRVLDANPHHTPKQIETQLTILARELSTDYYANDTPIEVGDGNVIDDFPKDKDAEEDDDGYLN
jgi:hypothetical protein